MKNPASKVAAARPLRIMKFGGTSVGNAACIQRVAEIIRKADRETDLVVVVSAMSGVTNQLIEAGMRAEAGDLGAAKAILAGLREQHNAALNLLSHSTEEREAILHRMQACFELGERICEEADSSRQLNIRARDSISSLGERLCAPLLASALKAFGVSSEVVEATELIVTDERHGNADPCMEATRKCCQARLRELLGRGIIPVVTGFIGATPEGALTTLGRGGSDYSATILGAALEAEEVIIWTDVDGLMTADPQLVEGACTIPEISYAEATELARFGAKVLHPKTLRALTQCGIPLWIRNTFAPQRSGTRITPAGPASNGGVKGLAAMSRRDYAPGVAPERMAGIAEDPTAAIVTAVGKDMRRAGTATRALAALALARVNILAIFEGSSDCGMSVIVAGEDTATALATLHREFQLGTLSWLPVARPAAEAAAYYQSEQPLANGD